MRFLLEKQTQKKHTQFCEPPANLHFPVCNYYLESYQRRARATYKSTLSPVSQWRFACPVPSRICAPGAAVLLLSFATKQDSLLVHLAFSSRNRSCFNREHGFAAVPTPARLAFWCHERTTPSFVVIRRNGVWDPFPPCRAIACADGCVWASVSAFGSLGDEEDRRARMKLQQHRHSIPPDVCVHRASVPSSYVNMKSARKVVFFGRGLPSPHIRSRATHAFFVSHPCTHTSCARSRKTDDITGLYLHTHAHTRTPHSGRHSAC